MRAKQGRLGGDVGGGGRARGFSESQPSAPDDQVKVGGKERAWSRMTPSFQLGTRGG